MIRNADLTILITFLVVVILSVSQVIMAYANVRAWERVLEHLS